MQTTGSLYRHISQQLLPLGESAGQQAFWLLEAVTGISRTQVVMDKPVALPEEQAQQLQEAVKRLLLHEPLQYVLEEAYFYGHHFKVSPAVLIPRPETEELVHRIIERHKKQPGLQILDVCTGSGCIALTLAKELPGAQVWATDISPQALAIAAENRERLQVEVQLIENDALRAAFPAENLDVVVSNPPYVLEKESALMQPNVLAWEPHLALFVPNEDALLFYKAIAQEAWRKLSRGGWLYFEINEAYGRQVVELLQQLGFKDAKVVHDMQGKERMAEGRKT